MLPVEEPASIPRTIHNGMYPKYQTLGLVQRTPPLKMRGLAERALEVVPLSALGAQLVTGCSLSCFSYLFSPGSCLTLSGRLWGLFFFLALRSRGPGQPQGVGKGLADSPGPDAGGFQPGRRFTFWNPAQL